MARKKNKRPRRRVRAPEWGGARPGAGRKPKPLGLVSAAAEAAARVPATPAAPTAMALTLAMNEVSVMSRASLPAANRASPFRLPDFPKKAMPPESLRMAMDETLNWGNDQWAGMVASYGAEGLLFPGYAYLSELSQRPEYRVMAETIATEMTRKWIKFKATSDDGAMRKGDKLKEITDEFARLEVQERYKGIAIQDSFFGRSHLYLDFGVDLDGALSGSDPELMTPVGNGRDEASRLKISKGSLRRLQPVEAIWAYPTTYNAMNPLREDWYNPQVWYVLGQMIHRSRLPIFIGHPVADLLKPSYAFGGLSMTQMAKPYVDIWLTTRQSVGQLIHSFSVMVLMTDMATITQPGNSAALMARVNMFNMLRDNQGTFVVNKSTEDFKNVSASLGGLHELQAQAQEHMASVARIPLVKFTGISPTGLNASSEGEMRAFYDTVHAFQESLFRPNLTRLMYFAMLSLWGEVDEEITFDFEPLWAMSEKEMSDIRKADAETAGNLIDKGVLHPAEERARIAADPDTLYPGLDVDDVPDLQQEEGEGLVPEGGGRATAEELAEEDDDAEGGPEGPAGEGGGEGGPKPAPKPKAPQKGSDGRQRITTDAAEGGGRDAAIIPFSATASGALGSDKAGGEFEESEHPRAPDGKFGSGRGGAAAAKPGQAAPGGGGGAAAAHQQTKVVGGKRVGADGQALPAHIQSLKIPPAWTDVTYAADPKASLLATGKDSKGRRQAVYSAEFSAKQAAAKFARISELSEKFGEVSAQNEAARKSSNPRVRAAADCTMLIMSTGIRPGSETDTGADKKAYGATTLEGQHVVVDGKRVSLQFVGKKGVSLNIPVEDPAVAKMLLARKAAAGDSGQIFEVSEKGLLDHVHTLDGGGFKSKDFRTHVGTSTAMAEVGKRQAPADEKAYKKAVMEVAKVVSTKLGNTPTIALQSYINPVVFSQWRAVA